MFICPITGGIKNEQLGEEVHGARSGRVPSTRGPVPMELRCATLPAHRRIRQLRSSCRKQCWLRMLNYLEG